ncbi:MAG: DUF4230 domain-containing protein [bacterium]
MKTYKWTIIISLVLIVLVGFVFTYPGTFGLVTGRVIGNQFYGFVENITSPIVGSLKPSGSKSRKITIDVLNSHDTIKLITREVQTNVTFTESEKYGWLSSIVGERKGTLTANITFVYGVDIKKIERKHVNITGDSIVVDLPTIQPLYVVPDMDSIQYRSESSLINKLIDEVHDLSLKQKIYSTLKKDAHKIARKRGLKPSEDEIYEDLESTLGPLIRAKTGRTLRFK